MTDDDDNASPTHSRPEDLRSDLQALRDLRKLPSGERTNRALYDHLLRPRFLGYWTFSEPEHRKVELSDAVFAWKDVVVLFEAKTRGVKKPADVGWLREKIGEAVDQLNKKAARLKAGGVVLRNDWRGEVDIDPTAVKDFYGVIVLVADFEPFEWREVADEEAKRATIPIQVYTLFDLAELLRFVDTPWDFIVYFESRARYSRNHKMLVGREIDTFAGVIGGLHRLEYWKDPAKADEIQSYWIDRGNAILRNSEATERGYRDWAASNLIDFGVAPSERKATLDARGKAVRSPEHDNYIAALEVLAEMSRNRRTAYGYKWLAAAEKAVATGALSSRSSYSPSRACSYVWIAAELGREPDHDEVARLALDAALRNRTTSALAVAASASSIIATFEWLVRVCKGEDVALLELEQSLAPVVAWVRSDRFGAASADASTA